MRRALLTVSALAALALGATQAFGTGNGPVVATDNQFEPGSPGSENGYIDAGEIGMFVNDGSNTHTVTATTKGPDGKALFRTGNTSGGQTKRIGGTQFLSEGIYSFRCSIHSFMTGTYEVFEDRAGTTPLPRPEISLKIKSKKVGKVLDSGKLQLKVAAKGPTAAQDISLKAKKGITKKKKLNLAVGAKKTTKLKLTGKGENKLADADSAKVKVVGTVAFGFGDKASKKLK